MNIKNNLGESLVGIIVGIFILSLVITGIGKLILHSSNMISTYEDAADIETLRHNVASIIKKIDTSSFLENDTLYIQKDSSTHQFNIFSGALNSHFQYIDKYGNYIPDITVFNGKIYSRSLQVNRNDTYLDSKNQIISITIKKINK